MKRKLLAFRTSIARGIGLGLLVLAAVLPSGRINGQSITSTNYPVSLGTGTLVTVPVSGLTIHSGASNDDTPGPLVPFGSGFVFWYGGAPYTSVSTGPDGFLRLGTAAAAQFTNDLVSTTNTPIIAPYWDDLATGTNGSVVGFLTGTAPNRIYVINWLVTIPRNTAGVPAATFQCWLYENGGKIEYVYGNNMVANTVTGYSVGHATTSGTPTRIATGTINATFSASTFAYVAAAPNNVNTLAIASGSKVTFTPPPGPAVPTSLTFTGVTPAGMTLNWVDNATTETGYAIFRSDDDGVSYALLTTIAANSTSYAATGLVPNKNFFWKIMAYSDLPPAGSLDGSQATSPPGIVVSTGTGGNWSNAATWSGGVVPIATDSVVIDNGDTVIVDVTTAVCWSLRVGTGTSGVLSYLSTPASTLSVGNNVFVSSGAIFDAGTGSLNTHSLRIGGTSATALGEGSLIVNGTFDMQTTAGVPVTFFGINNASVSGTPTVLDFRSVTLNKGASSTAPPTLEFLTGFTVQGANTIGLLGTHTAGTLKLSGSFTQNSTVYTTTGYTIPALGGIWLNNANFTIDGQNGSPTNNGLLRVTSGTYNIGTATGNSLAFGAGARFTVEGGTMNVTGRINTGNAITFTCSGGTINVATIGNASSGNPSFGITSTGSTAVISGGTLNLVQRNTGATIIDYNVAAGSGSVTGGTLNVGTAATTTNFNFRIQGVTPSVVIDNTTNNKTLTLSGATNILGTLTIPVNDTLNLNNFTMQVFGSVTNNGHINGKGSGVIQFTGTAAQSYGGSGGVDSLFRIIDDNENGGVTFNKAVYAQSVYFYDTAMIYNSSNITLGYNNLPVTLQYGVAGGTKVVGQFDVLPTMNLGTGTYSITYAQESAPRTTGMEVPVSRTIRNLVINNSSGVVVNGGPLNLEVGGVLTLTNGKLTTTAANIINVMDSITGAVSGGSATAYVNGPMTRQLPAALYNQRTYNFPVGKATYKLFELINPGTNSGGAVTVGVETFDANSGGTAGLNMTTVDTTQYWRVQLVAGSSNIDSANMRVTSSGFNGLSRLTYASTVNGAYDKISVIPLSATQIRTAATRLTGTAIEGFYGLGNEVVGLSGTYLVGASQTAPNYTNLTSVITDLNSKQVQGNVIFELQSDYNATTETFPLTFTEPAKTDAAWTITIQPGAGTTDSIYGSFNGPLVNLSAIRNVILEGRQGGSGTPKSLIVKNDNTGASATAVTLINDARNNTLRYAVFKGASTTATAGVITLSTGITTGNDSNTIDNCDIADAATTPASLISSQGSTDILAKYNDYNTVTNCNLYNFFNSTAEANGFKLSNGTNNWTITGNSIYQTAARNTSGLHYTFNLQNSDNRNALNNMIITNNYIGGSAPMCGGTPWTMTSAAGRICSFFNMGNLAMSRVSNNTFANFNCATTSTATGAPGTWNAIQYVNGMLNIDSNIIGNSDTSSIVLTTGAAGVALPIAVTASSTAGTYSITGNTIGSIKMNGGGTVSNNLTCINITTSVNTITYNVDNNTIGNSFPDNLLAASSNSATAQSIIGINNTGVVNFKARNNMIRNMLNVYSGTGTGRVVGISASSGKDTILNNTISMLESTTPQTGSGTNSSVVGISFTSTTGGSLVSRNTIYDLANTNTTGAVKVTGIHYSGGTGDIIGRNAVHSFSTVSTSNTAQQTGINYAGGTSVVQNNMVRLGIDAAGANQTTAPVIIGMAKTGGNLNAYFNTVYVGGTGVVDSIVNTYAFNKSASNSDTVYNNIFVNQRANAGAVGGGHYAISLNNITGWIANNNVYYVNGTGDTLAIANGITYQGIGDWKLATAKDAASIFGDPSFVNATGNAGAVNIHLTGATPAEGTGLAIASVNEDFDGDDRSAFTPTDIGADGGNFTPVDLSPPSISFAAIANDTIKVTRPLTDYFTIADPSGVKLTGANAPRFYYKKKTDLDAFVGNTSADNGWKYVSIGNLTNPYTFTIDYTIINGGSVSIGDTIQYFIVAQDSAASPNVGAIPSTGFVASSVSTVVAAPSSPGFYAIKPYPLTGAYTVGTSAPADYATINAALTSVNQLGTKGNVTLSLIDALYDGTTGETFPITLNSFASTDTIYTVTIKPAVGVSPVITNASATSVFKFVGANYIIDGSNTIAGTTRDMSIVNTSTGTNTAVIHFASQGVGLGSRKGSVMNSKLQNGSNTATNFGVYAGSNTIGTGGADNMSIGVVNNVITKTRIGIQVDGTSTTNPANGLTIADNFIGSLAIADYIGFTGIRLSNATNANISGNTIKNIVTASTNPPALVLAAGVTNTMVDGNIIDSIRYTGASGYGGRGIMVGTGLAASNITIQNNAISNMGGDGWTGFNSDNIQGISIGTIQSGATVVTGGVKVYFNTVSLTQNSAGSASGTVSYAFIATAVASNLDVRNNIFSNSLINTAAPTHKGYAFVSLAPASAYTNLNYNDYTGNGSQSVLGYFNGVDQTTLPAFASATGQDANSIAVYPGFVSSNDLRPGIGIVNGLGTPIAGVTLDIVDSVRSNPPAMGAYEYGVDVTGPAISYTPIVNINSTANYVLTGFATITDVTGVNTTPGTAPRIWYKKRSDSNIFGTYPTDNNASFNGWKYVEASNATSPFNFTIDNTLLTGGTVVQGVDTIQYFVAAQDIVAPTNYVSANPSAGFVGTAVNAVTVAPTTPNQYIIVDAPLAGPYNVGVGQIAPNYVTITAAIADMNLRGISAAVTFNLMDASYTTPSESFPVTLTSVVGTSATNTVTIKPSTGVVTTVTGSSATSIFKISGADYIIFDGSNSGSASRDMTVENTNASTTTAVMWVASAGTTNGASNNTLKNMNITGNAGTTTAVGIVSGSGVTIGAAGDSANSNNTIQGCSFTKAQNGIFILGNAINVDMNWSIMNNIAGSTNAPDKLGLRGIALQNAQNFTISGNLVQGVVTATTTTSSGILIGGLATNGMVSRNRISDVKNTNVGEWGANGLQLSSTNVAANITSLNNFISDVTGVGFATGAGVADNGYGIIITSGGGYNLYYNTVHMNTSQGTDGLPAALNVAATVTAPSSLDIRNNIFMNSQTQTGEKYSVYFGATNAVINTMNYNNYFANAGANLAFLGANVANLAALQTAFGGNGNSISDSTNFVSTADLHITGPTVFNHAYIGTPIVGITTDIDGQTREPLFPYMGADEDIAFPLPVTLTSFAATAKTNDVLVTWTTSSEINNKGFEVQRSVDGRNFEFVTFVKGAGNSSRVINYNSTDAKAFDKANSTVLYYRLKQVDFNGESTFSNTVKVMKNVAAANALTVYPNPFNTAYSVSFEAVNAGTASLVMVDLQGKTVASHTSPVVNGSNTISFDNLNDLQTGVYFVKVTVDGETQVLKLVKN